MRGPMTSHRPKPQGKRVRQKPKAVREAEAEQRERAKQAEPFRVLLAIHRPRYRSHAERAVALPGWEVRSLLNREDPIGILNQGATNLFILSVDVAENKGVGFLRAAQRYRSADLRIIGLFENAEEAEDNAAACDAAFAPPWRTSELRAKAVELYTQITGRPLAAPDPVDEDHGD